MELLTSTGTENNGRLSRKDLHIDFPVQTITGSRCEDFKRIPNGTGSSISNSTKRLSDI